MELQRQHFERDIRQLHEAGQGCMTLVIVTQASSASLVADAMNGDTTAKIVLNAADQQLRQIHRRSRPRALTCGLCDSGTLWRGEAPAAVGVLLPYGADPVRIATGLVFCASCAADRTARELGMAAVAKLRSDWMPDLRTFTPAEAGHA
jgi:hypothetical protein